jgi:ferredoxin
MAEGIDTLDIMGVAARPVLVFVSFCKIENRKQIPKIEYDYCTGCGICANECPVDAIKMVRAA